MTFWCAHLPSLSWLALLTWRYPSKLSSPPGCDLVLPYPFWVKNMSQTTYQCSFPSPATFHSHIGKFYFARTSRRRSPPPSHRESSPYTLLCRGKILSSRKPSILSHNTSYSRWSITSDSDIIKAAHLLAYLIGLFQPFWSAKNKSFKYMPVCGWYR